MRSKNAKTINAAERDWLRRVKSTACAVCDAPPPVDAHHVRQGFHFATIGVCRDCHNSWHGTKALWRIRKLDEIAALNISISRAIATE